MTERRPTAPRLCQHVYALQQWVDPGCRRAEERRSVSRVSGRYLLFYFKSGHVVLIVVIRPQRWQPALQLHFLCTFNYLISLFFNNFPFKREHPGLPCWRTGGQVSVAYAAANLLKKTFISPSVLVCFSQIINWILVLFMQLFCVVVGVLHLQ